MGISECLLLSCHILVARENPRSSYVEYISDFIHSWLCIICSKRDNSLTLNVNFILSDSAFTVLKSRRSRHDEVLRIMAEMSD